MNVYSVCISIAYTCRYNTIPENVVIPLTYIYISEADMRMYQSVL